MAFLCSLNSEAHSNTRQDFDTQFPRGATSLQCQWSSKQSNIYGSRVEAQLLIASLGALDFSVIYKGEECQRSAKHQAQEEEETDQLIYYAFCASDICHMVRKKEYLAKFYLSTSSSHYYS